MYTPVGIHFSADCWRLLRTEAQAASLSAELRAILDLSRKPRAAPTDPSPRYVVALLRLHMHELLTCVGRILSLAGVGGLRVAGAPSDAKRTA